MATMNRQLRLCLLERFVLQNPESLRIRKIIGHQCPERFHGQVKAGIHDHQECSTNNYQWSNAPRISALGISASALAESIAPQENKVFFFPAGSRFCHYNDQQLVERSNPPMVRPARTRKDVQHLHHNFLGFRWHWSSAMQNQTGCREIQNSY